MPPSSFLVGLQASPLSSRRWTTSTRSWRLPPIAHLNFPLPSEQLSRLGRTRSIVTTTKQINQRCTVLLWVSLPFFRLQYSVTIIILVLHPRHKLEYFKAQNWEHEWIQAARNIVRDEFDRSYKGSAIRDDKDAMQVDNSVSIIILLRRLYSLKPSVVEEHLR